MEDHKASKQANYLTSGDSDAAILLCKTQESEIDLCSE